MSSQRMDANEESTDGASSWLNWCRLCAQQEIKEEEESGVKTLSIFNKIQENIVDYSLATAIGKYFWVNVKMEDHVPKRLCANCKWLIEELSSFTERVNKVQAMYCILENLKPSTLDEVTDIRKQCGLIDENWQHLVFKCKDSYNDKIHFHEELGQLNEVENEENINLELDDEASQNLILITNVVENGAAIPVRYVDFNKEIKSRKKEEGNQVIQQYIYEVQPDDLDSVAMQKSSEAGNFLSRMVMIEKDEKSVRDCDIINELKCKLDEDRHFSANIDNETSNDGTQVKFLRVISKNMDTDQNADNSVEVCIEENCESSESVEQNNDNYNHNNGKDSDMDICDDEAEAVANGDGDGDVDGNYYLEKTDEKSDADNSTQSTETFDFLKKRPRGRPTNSWRGYETGIRYTCSTCDRRYKNPNIYRKHMKVLHKIDVHQLPDFICSICNKDCRTESRLKKHSRTHLPAEEKLRWPCPHCDRKFSQVGAVRLHLTSVHEQVKPFICDQCGRACKTLAALNEHQLVHTTECPFECDVCKKRFKNKARLKTHMDIHAGETYVCPDCGLKLNTRRTLLAHRLVHTDVKRFKCQFCDAAFKRAKAFKNHLLLHTGMRPYKCNFCTKTFSNGSNCRSHKRKAHPKELAESEAQGEKPEPVIIPKLEDLQSVQAEIAQPRKAKRFNKTEQLKEIQSIIENSQEPYIASTYMNDNNDEYEIVEGLWEAGQEDCEETVIYECVDDDDV